MMSIACARRALIVMGLAVSFTLATAPSAHALWWRDWPGSGTTTTTGDTTTTTDDTTTTTTGGGGGGGGGNTDTGTDTEVEIIGDPDPGPDDLHNPEPSTLLAGLIGF